MKSLRLFASLILFAPFPCFAQQTGPFTPDSTTRGLWHFDEASGSSVLDFSGGGNTGLATGTTIVPGQFGNSRSFNGLSDFVSIPSSAMFDFDTSSFRIDLSFKAPEQQSGHGQILRRGLAPAPGYMIFMDHGQIAGQIGNRSDSHWPDTLITVRSDSTYGDGEWHSVSMVRDRTVRKLFLYIDGKLATQPSEDPFTIPINNTEPLTVGRWMSEVYPYFFNGAVDEIRLSSPKLIPPSVVIHVTPALLDFGKVNTGSRDTLLLHVSSGGVRDTLRISSVSSGNPRFSVPAGPFHLAPGEAVTIPVCYAPVSAAKDTGLVTIMSNDPDVPRTEIRVVGTGFSLSAQPIIEEIAVVPYTYYQIRVRWLRSMYDSADVPDPVTEYSIWRAVQGSSPSGTRPAGYNAPAWTLVGPAWEFLATVPALGFDGYSCVVPALVDYSRVFTPNVIMIAARTRDLRVFLSDPDTVQVDPPSLTGVGGGRGGQQVTEFTLLQNYPNPFNPSTTIRYGLPRGVHVTLAVYNALGQEVARLVDEVQQAGYHEAHFDGTNRASGVYFYRLRAGDFIQTMRLILLR